MLLLPHGPKRSSPPLFSPYNSNPSNGDHDGDVMCLDESNFILETYLLIFPYKLIV